MLHGFFDEKFQFLQWKLSRFFLHLNAARDLNLLNVRKTSIFVHLLENAKFLLSSLTDYAIPTLI